MALLHCSCSCRGQSADTAAHVQRSGLSHRRTHSRGSEQFVMHLLAPHQQAWTWSMVARLRGHSHQNMHVGGTRSRHGDTVTPITRSACGAVVPGKAGSPKQGKYMAGQIMRPKPKLAATPVAGDALHPSRVLNVQTTPRSISSPVDTRVWLVEPHFVFGRRVQFLAAGFIINSVSPVSLVLINLVSSLGSCVPCARSNTHESMRTEAADRAPSNRTGTW
jgi:hypothetical protein